MPNGSGHEQPADITDEVGETPEQPITEILADRLEKYYTAHPSMRDVPDVDSKGRTQVFGGLPTTYMNEHGHFETTPNTPFLFIADEVIITDGQATTNHVLNNAQVLYGHARITADGWVFGNGKGVIDTVRVCFDTGHNIDVVAACATRNPGIETPVELDDLEYYGVTYADDGTTLDIMAQLDEDGKLVVRLSPEGQGRILNADAVATRNTEEQVTILS